MPAHIETERLLLRELTEADAPAVLRLNARPEVVRFVGEPTLASVEEALDALRKYILPQYANHGVGRLGVILRGSDELIGWCGLKYLEESREYDLGYRFLPEHWGRGYATEAARAVLERGLRELRGARIVGKAAVENVASIRVLEKLGMRFEGHEAEHCGMAAVYVARNTTTTED